MTQNKIPLAGVIGSPIAHSKSPRLYGYWLQEYGLPGHYVPLDISAENLATALKAMPDMGFVGANVTVPHKEIALDLATEVTDAARRIGAANTLTFLPNGGFSADNTDGYGFIENLRQNAPSWSPAEGPAAVLGAGGAARAIVVSLLDAGAPEILIANRTRERAEALAAEFGPRLKVWDWNKAGDMLREATTVANTTALGMQGKPPLTVTLDHLRDGALVTDLVYAPLKTDLLATAEQKGCAIVDGLGMLLHQAAPGFERWFGQCPEVTDATRQAVLQ